MSPNLPYYANGSAETVDAIIEAAIAKIYSPNGEGNKLAMLTFDDGGRKPLTAPQVMSGALIASAVAEAKRCSCFRRLKGGAVGIATVDLLAAVDRELSGIAERLKPGPALHQMLDLPSDLAVVRVDVIPRKERPRSYENLRM